LYASGEVYEAEHSRLAAVKWKSRWQAANASRILCGAMREPSLTAQDPQANKQKKVRSERDFE